MSGTTTVYSGEPVELPFASSWFRDHDYRRGGFYHRRQGLWYSMLNVNMRALIDWNEANGAPFFAPTDNSDWGLVVYLTVIGPQSNANQNNYAVPVFDSADLNSTGGSFPWPAPPDPTGLTVVSDQAIFAEGNYNSIEKYPAAVIGDAVNVLSHGCERPFNETTRNPVDNDQKSNFNMSSNNRDVPSSDRYAYKRSNSNRHRSWCSPNGCTPPFGGTDDLTVNAAFIMGIGTEGDGVYNGGLENFKRFHESWSYGRLNYLGSFVTLGTPLHQDNYWECGSGNTCNVYDPPERW